MPMNQRMFGLVQYCAIALALFGVSVIEPVMAQNRVEIRCGEANLTSFSTSIPGFAGEYYYIAEWGQGDADARELGLITTQGEQRIPILLPSDVARSVGGPFVSPDGSKIAFPPFSLRSRNLIIWDRNTNEIASLELPQEIADYLSDQDDNPDLAIVNFSQLVWRSSSELWIQYFGDYPDINNPLLRIRLTVQERPLRITPQTGSAIVDFEVIQALARPPQIEIASPDGAYRLEVQDRGQGLSTRQFQVYDTRANRVVFEVQSSEAARIVGTPLWSSDRSHVFYVESVPTGTKLAQLNVNEGFRRDTLLDTLLQNEFGSSTGISSTFPPILSRDGSHLGFGYINQVTNEYYTIRYNTLSGETIALCDEFPTSSDWYPFWSPSNRFIAYWYGGIVKVYDFETGNRYLLPGTGFAGWISP
ncbi:MAG: hypothetical protein U0670_19000 [Anaerolineae bacterium]